MQAVLNLGDSVEPPEPPRSAPALMSSRPSGNDLNRFYLDLNISNISLVSSSMEENFWNKPTLLWFTPKLGLDTETGMELLCLVGMLLSLLAMSLKSFRGSVVFSILWFLYFSLYQVKKKLSSKESFIAN